MPLALNDPRWNELQSSYGSIEDVVTRLAQAYEEKGLSHEQLGDLINEVQHQGGTSAAMYAVAPHLVSLAHGAAPETSLDLLISAGMIYASIGQAGAVACPEFLREEFVATTLKGARLLAELLPLAVQFDSFKWAVAGLAGFMGHDRFARFLDGLDFYDGKFHHLLLGGPFPSET